MKGVDETTDESVLQWVRRENDRIAKRACVEVWVGSRLLSRPPKMWSEWIVYDRMMVEVCDIYKKPWGGGFSVAKPST